MISRLDNLSCHYGNYRRLEAQRKWDVTLRKRREIRGIKPEKRLLNMMTGYRYLLDTFNAHNATSALGLIFGYIRETWRVQSAHRFEADAKIEFRAGGPLGKIQFPGGCSDSESREAFDQFIAKWSTDSKWNPSIFMPKEAARTFLKIVDVSVERLGDINGGGLKAEGIDRNQPYRAMRMDFRDLWNSTISADQLDELGWYANPWVFVYKFQQIGREEALA